MSEKAAFPRVSLRGWGVVPVVDCSWDPVISTRVECGVHGCLECVCGMYVSVECTYVCGVLLCGAYSHRVYACVHLCVCAVRVNVFMWSICVYVVYICRMC